MCITVYPPPCRADIIAFNVSGTISIIIIQRTHFDQLFCITVLEITYHYVHRVIIIAEQRHQSISILIRFAQGNRKRIYRRVELVFTGCHFRLAEQCNRFGAVFSYFKAECVVFDIIVIVAEGKSVNQLSAVFCRLCNHFLSLRRVFDLHFCQAFFRNNLRPSQTQTLHLRFLCHMFS